MMAIEGAVKGNQETLRKDSLSQVQQDFFSRFSCQW
jgi:hypothetical protein